MQPPPHSFNAPLCGCPARCVGCDDLKLMGIALISCCSPLTAPEKNSCTDDTISVMTFAHLVPSAGRPAAVVMRYSIPLPPLTWQVLCDALRGPLHPMCRRLLAVAGSCNRTGLKLPQCRCHDVSFVPCSVTLLLLEHATSSAIWTVGSSFRLYRSSIVCMHAARCHALVLTVTSHMSHKAHAHSYIFTITSSHVEQRLCQITHSNGQNAARVACLIIMSVTACHSAQCA